jgi:hypothetical protein
LGSHDPFWGYSPSDVKKFHQAPPLHHIPVVLPWGLSLQWIVGAHN